MNMAKRKYSKMKKIEPSVQTLFFATPSVSGGANDKFHIDLSQCASLVNRRFYRQGINWAVSSIKITSSVTGTIGVSKLPNTWILSNAWEKGFRAWQKMNKEATDDSPSVRPKFLDFKIYADQSHHTDGYAANLLPFDGAGNQYTRGEWVHSTFHIPNTAVDSSDPASNSPRSVIAVGANYQAVGADGNYAVSLIEGYAASRGLPNVLDPNVPGDAASVNQSTVQNWIAALDNDFDQQEGQVLADMITENNIAPYPFENDGTHTDTMYPGGANQAPGLELHDQDKLTATTIGGMSRIKGGNFPCGLMQFNWAPSESGNILIQIDLVPGTHRGYLCEPMTEM